MQVLSSLKAVLVRATVSKTMQVKAQWGGICSSLSQETMLRKVMMDISVPQPTGGPPARGLEECRCPPQVGRRQVEVVSPWPAAVLRPFL